VGRVRLGLIIIRFVTRTLIGIGLVASVLIGLDNLSDGDWLPDWVTWVCLAAMLVMLPLLVREELQRRRAAG
jgi:hypothetical protein